MKITKQEPVSLLPKDRREGEEGPHGVIRCTVRIVRVSIGVRGVGIFMCEWDWLCVKAK